MIAWARTAVFMVVFWGLSVPIVLGAPIAALFGTRALRWYVIGWLEFHRWSARWLVGIRIKVIGDATRRPALYAGKHQAMFETFELTRMLNAPAMMMKRELANIPVWGWVARRYGVIVVDREASAAALRQMMREGQAAIAAGRSVVIFPEGTRVVPGQRPPLRSGFAGLYRTLKLAVVPVAIDSGVLWPKHGAKRSGTITIEFGESLPPGLPRAEIEQQVHTAINRLDVEAQG
jgi:1-acyl-sn-glycerol-3-phosphate acyltransferase